MLNGIVVCGKRYHSLAFSSSQLRENDCWFVEESLNAREIISMLG